MNMRQTKSGSTPLPKFFRTVLLIEISKSQLKSYGAFGRTCAAISPAFAKSSMSSHKWLIALAVMLRTTLECLTARLSMSPYPTCRVVLHQRRRDRLGGDQLPSREWHHDPDDRLDFRALRAQALLFDVSIRFRGCLRVVRRRPITNANTGIPLSPGRVAAMVPSSQAILVEAFPPEERQLAMAVWGMGVMVASIAGPTIGGWITENWNWRWNFYVNIPIGIMAFLMVSAFVHDPAFMHERQTTGGKVDYVGIVLLVLGFGLLQLQIVLDRAQRADWFSTPWVIYATGSSALSFVLLILREASFSEPIIDLQIFKQRAFDVATILQVSMSFVLFATILLSPLFLQDFLLRRSKHAGSAACH
jgi:hypothetical protein